MKSIIFFLFTGIDQILDKYGPALLAVLPDNFKADVYQGPWCVRDSSTNPQWPPVIHWYCALKHANNSLHYAAKLLDNSSNFFSHVVHPWEVKLHKIKVTSEKITKTHTHKCLKTHFGENISHTERERLRTEYVMNNFNDFKVFDSFTVIHWGPLNLPKRVLKRVLLPTTGRAHVSHLWTVC